MTLYRAGIRSNPESPRLQWLAGRELFYSGRSTEAEAYFAAAREIDQAYEIDYRVFAALVALNERRPEDALRIADLIPAPNKMDILEVSYIYGAASAMAGEIARAREYYETAEQSRIRLGLLRKVQVEEAAGRLNAR